MRLDPLSSLIPALYANKGFFRVEGEQSSFSARAHVR